MGEEHSGSSGKARGDVLDGLSWHRRAGAGLGPGLSSSAGQESRAGRAWLAVLPLGTSQ